jgi:hypothetical protein
MGAWKLNEAKSKLNPGGSKKHDSPHTRRPAK